MHVTKHDIYTTLDVSQRAPDNWLRGAPIHGWINKSPVYDLLDVIPRIRRRPRGLKGAELRGLFECARERGVGADEDTLYVGGVERAQALFDCLSPPERERWHVAAAIFEGCLVESPAFARPVFRDIESLRLKLLQNPDVARYVFLADLGDLPERMPQLAVEFAIVNATLRVSVPEMHAKEAA